VNTEIPWADPRKTPGIPKRLSEERKPVP